MVITGNVTYTQYPFGYLGIQMEDDRRDGDPDVYIDELFKRYTGLSTREDLACFRTDVIEYAIKQFASVGGFFEFITLNLNEAKITDLQRRFLQDTYKFILKGRRDIDIGVWDSLLVASNENDVKTKRPKEYHYDYILTNKGDDLLGLWLMQSGGFQDMLWSLKIIFGSVAK